MSPLPRAIALTKGVILQVVDYRIDFQQAEANTNGIATVTWDQVASDQLWRVERLIVSHTSANQLLATVYGGNPGVSSERDWTPIPPGYRAIAEYPQPVTIEPVTQLAVICTGAAPGDLVYANAQYAIVQRMPAG